MTDFSASLSIARNAMDGLRKTLCDILLAHKINRLPKLNGSTDCIRIPRDIDNLTASEVMAMCEVVNKLVNFTPREDNEDSQALPHV